MADPITTVVTQVTESVSHGAEASGHSAVAPNPELAYMLLLAFFIFPFLFVAIRLWQARGSDGEKLTTRQRCSWRRILSEVTVVIPEHKKGQWAQILVHTWSVAFIGPWEISSQTLTGLEAAFGSGALSLLPAVLVVFHLLDKRGEHPHNMVLKYASVISLGCVQVILIAHIAAGTHEVGPAIFIINLALVASLVVFNDQSSGSRTAREGISHESHYDEQVDDVLADLGMRALHKEADSIRKALSMHHYQEVTSEGGLLDVALSRIYDSDNQIDTPIEVRRERFVAGVERMRNGERSAHPLTTSHTGHKHMPIG